jgi:uncharacterized protein YecT (DUF1311 family)
MIIAFAALALLAQEPAADAPDCRAPHGNLEMALCWGQALEREEARMRRYYRAAQEAVSRPPEYPQGAPVNQARAYIEASQSAWRAYSEIACQGVYEAFGEGTARNLAMTDCTIEMTRERTRVLWRDYLRDAESEDFPEPRATVDIDVE